MKIELYQRLKGNMISTRRHYDSAKYSYIHRRRETSTMTTVAVAVVQTCMYLYSACIWRIVNFIMIIKRGEIEF